MTQLLANLSYNYRPYLQYCIYYVDGALAFLYLKESLICQASSYLLDKTRSGDVYLFPEGCYIRNCQENGLADISLFFCDFNFSIIS